MKHYDYDIVVAQVREHLTDLALLETVAERIGAVGRSKTALANSITDVLCKYMQFKSEMELICRDGYMQLDFSQYVNEVNSKRQRSGRPCSLPFAIIPAIGMLGQPILREITHDEFRLLKKGTEYKLTKHGEKIMRRELREKEDKENKKNND